VHRERRIEPEHQIRGLQWKVDPASPETDPAMSRPVEQLVAEKAPDVGHDFRVARRMQSVAAVVDSHTTELEAAGVPARDSLLFKHCHVRAVEAAELIGTAHAGRARTGPTRGNAGLTAVLRATTTRPPDAQGDVPRAVQHQPHQSPSNPP
jgi:hypothetical protein